MGILKQVKGVKWSQILCHSNPEGITCKLLDVRLLKLSIIVLSNAPQFPLLCSLVVSHYAPNMLI